MSESYSDALVFFGATGDLAYKKIFPALQAMVRRGHLKVPVIGVAKAGWTLDNLKARARDSVEKHGGLDPAAFAKLNAPLALRGRRLQGSGHVRGLAQGTRHGREPAHYLAIPPVMFGVVVEGLGKSGVRESPALLSKSLLAGTSPRRERSTKSYWAISPNRRSFGSTII